MARFVGIDRYVCIKDVKNWRRCTGEIRGSGGGEFLRYICRKIIAHKRMKYIRLYVRSITEKKKRRKKKWKKKRRRKLGN